jgi:hypothetical protein
MANRAHIKSTDLDVSEIIGLSATEGWVAVYSPNETKPVVFWVVLRAGEVVGLVGGEPNGKVIDGELRAADKVLNFTNYRMVP